MNRIPLISILALALGACGSEEGTQLLVPAQLEFSWNTAYNDEGDGLAAVVPFDVMVYDAESGDALAGMDVELRSDVVALMPAELVESAAPDCDTCLWDAESDAYVSLEGEAETPLEVTTDADGIARVHAVVDTLPQNGAEEFGIQVRLGARAEWIRLLPQ